jgi:predicted HAD superfamily Cof-like phosphohydrolase
MRVEQNKVADFHRKHGFPEGIAIGQDPKTDMVRVHLIAEELGELALAIAERDRVKASDALADLAYVVLGAAVTWDIPLAAVFDEVHRSNMTKAVRSAVDTRLRDKGASYVPADIASVLDDYTDNLKKIEESK